MSDHDVSEARLGDARPLTAPGGSLRPGGRSARVQASVHAAVTALLDRLPREAITVPMVAAEAGVTPSTIYRRWGDLAALYADVAMRRLRPDGPPPDTGSLASDLRIWVEAWAEEIGSVPGRAMLRDVVGAAPVDPALAPAGPACRLQEATRDQLAAILAREQARGGPARDVDRAADAMLAPILFRLIFDAAGLPPGYAAALVDRFLREAVAEPEAGAARPHTARR